MYMVPDIASVNKYLKGLLENLEIELILITKGARLPYVPTQCTNSQAECLTIDKKEPP